MKNKINRNGNLYTIAYACVLVIVVGTLLALCATWLKPFQQQNIDNETKQQILSTVDIRPANGENLHHFADEAFARHIVERFAVDAKGDVIAGVDAFKVNLTEEFEKQPDDRQLPLFKAIAADGVTRYIVPLRGKGLWGPIWGYISLNEDFKTVYGAIFDHKSETPGLGAEIATEHFQSQFKGKLIFNATGQFVAVTVAKPSARHDSRYSVDAISGATITSNGVQAMIFDCLKPYLPYFNRIQTEREARERAERRAAFVADSIEQARVAAETEAREKALRAYRWRQKKLRDSLEAVNNQQVTTQHQTETIM